MYLNKSKYRERSYHNDEVANSENYQSALQKPTLLLKLLIVEEAGEDGVQLHVDAY